MREALLFSKFQLPRLKHLGMGAFLKIQEQDEKFISEKFYHNSVCRRALVTISLLSILNYTELYLSELYLPLFSEVHCDKLAALIIGLFTALSLTSIYRRTGEYFKYITLEMRRT